MNKPWIQWAAWLGLIVHCGFYAFIFSNRYAPWLEQFEIPLIAIGFFSVFWLWIIATWSSLARTETLSQKQAYITTLKQGFLTIPAVLMFGLAFTSLDPRNRASQSMPDSGFLFLIGGFMWLMMSLFVANASYQLMQRFGKRS